MTVFILDNSTPEHRSFVRALISGLAATARFFDSEPEARAAIQRQPLEPHLVMLNPLVPDSRKLLSWVRAHDFAFNVPVIVIADEQTETGFRDALELGADDSWQRNDAMGLERRVIASRDYVPGTRPATRRGQAIIVHADASARRSNASILRRGGYDTVDAAKAEDLIRRGAALKPKIAVLGAEGRSPTSAKGLVTDLRTTLGFDDLPVALVMSDAMTPAGVENVRAIAARDCMQHLVFVAQELTHAAPNARASARVPYGTLCQFRPHNERRYGYGYTHNISREGLFVRSFEQPPPDFDVSIEVHPAGADRQVRLMGCVVWRRGLREGSGGGSPAGFGLRLVPEECDDADLGAYHSAYDGLKERWEPSG